ncbi:hypothetical protein DC094_05565 [Pelagibaculum spongiae]|uniref:Uncharacterized protein n=2 Tax=Pelagibaculum spongiae TaxID=2080658 RepID=A0A2V1GZG6_9GAMM|nr:hypothetical protein DC094_05565 [Pelagibaculum spongiae]
MQRLISFAPSQSSYVAVFDTLTDIEIDTNPTDDPAALKGIELDTVNPWSNGIQEFAGKLYISSIGSFASNTFIGGIETIDPSNYQTNLLVDDDDLGAKVSGIALVDSNTGYILAYNAYQDVSLVKFNPSTGDILTNPVQGYINQDLRYIETSPNLNLWLGIAHPSDAGIDRIDPATDIQIGSRISTEGLYPSQIIFTDR